ncbi:hypothetical protein AA15237_1798 [Komagataeibacter xylinus NBRC 15237]|nr:hypothetical protein AA15237_1798 [Komagataeibacter xylinus NBRC 15237]
MASMVSNIMLGVLYPCHFSGNTDTPMPMTIAKAISVSICALSDTPSPALWHMPKIKQTVKIINITPLNFLSFISIKHGKAAI